MLPEFNPVMTPEERASMIDGLRVAIEAYPEAAAALIARGQEESLKQQFAHRLKRPLTEDERRTLEQRLTTMGLQRLGVVVLDLSADQIAAWLADLAAR